MSEGAESGAEATPSDISVPVEIPAVDVCLKEQTIASHQPAAVGPSPS